MLDPITALALTGNILQFIELGLKATSKARDIYNSADGVTAENADLEFLTQDILAVTTKLAVSSGQASGNGSLDDICRRCTTSANDLLVTLQRLKVEGPKGKWKSARKGLKAVWGKKNVDELRGRLEGWRDEIQFRILVQLRNDVGLITIRDSERFDTLDDYAKALLGATAASDISIRGTLVAEGESSARRHTEMQNVVRFKHDELRDNLRDIALVESQTSDRRHERTAEVITSQNFQVQKTICDAITVESENSGERHEQTRNEITAKQTESQAEITQALEVLDSNIRAEQESTRLELEQLRLAMAQIEEDMARRDDELKALLVELCNSKSDRDKKRIQEKSNAVSTALYALVTVYDTLQKMLHALQAQAKLAMASATLAVFWNARQTGYDRISDQAFDRRMIKGYRWSRGLKCLLSAFRSPAWKVVHPVNFKNLRNGQGTHIGGILDIMDFSSGLSRFGSFTELRFGSESDAAGFDYMVFLIIISSGLVHATGSPENAASVMGGSVIEKPQAYSFGSGMPNSDYHVYSLLRYQKLRRLVSAWAAVGRIAGLEDIAIQILKARCTKWDIEETEVEQNTKGVEDLVGWLFEDDQNDTFSFNVVSVNGGRAGGAALFSIIDYFIHFGFPLNPPAMEITPYGLRATVARPALLTPALRPTTDGISISALRSQQSIARMALDSNRFRREQNAGKLRANVLNQVRIIDDRLAQDPINTSFARLVQGQQVEARGL
ncbi:hypothetical protein VTL71DRAFT_3767 [Oculimacula yallundae]|uniref:Fungal N-terminal domain-containing protein n=1 Tax=Oculimacula yallundae TaxID=86028 RepID=A0ABR4C4N7_9HELO